MSNSYYDRLTMLDNSFLVYENEDAGMHIASTQIFEAEPLRGLDVDVDVDRITDYVYSRLDRIPRYRQRIRRTPIERHPVWVDDGDFNINYHVRHSALPHPGTERQLKRLVGRIFSQRLDRDKPLWELWVVEGLEGDRVVQLRRDTFLGICGGLESSTRPARSGRCHGAGIRGVGGVGRGLVAIDAASHQCEGHDRKEAQARSCEEHFAGDRSDIRARDEFPERSDGRGLARKLQDPRK